MKKMIASAGMFAVGAAGLNAANVGDLSPELTAKRWNVSAALRGFYDDNYATRPNGPDKKGSGGLQFTPTASINMPMEQTFLSASYTFSLLYYFDRPGDDVDQSHTVNVKVDHKFSERHRLKFEDTFVYSSEPTILDQGGTISTPVLRQGVEGIHNLAPFEFEWQLTRLFSLALGYQNTYYNYFDSGDGSYSALLDRVENLLRVDGRYLLTEHNTALVGYQFGLIDYTSSDLLVTGGLPASSRNNQSHYFYGGYEQEFANHLSLAVRAGAVYTDYTKLTSDENNLSPYVDLSVAYQYLPGDNLRIGLKQAHNPTDQAGTATDDADLVLDQDTTTVYLSVTHRLTQKLTANGTVQYQHSIYNGGSLDGDADDYVNLSLLLAYKFTRNWSAELEYDFDNLVSEVPGRDFTRNRVFAGARFIF